MPPHEGAPRSVRKERLLVALVALVTTYGFFVEYLPPFKKVHLWSDVEGYHYPLQRYAFQSLKQGRIPQWDASIYSGITFAGNVQAAFLYPPTWLMYAATWKLPKLPFKALEVFTFLHIWGGFLLCYLWLRGRAGPLASALGAAVFAFTGHMLQMVLHTGVTGAMTWMPLALWGIDESVEKRTWLPLWKVAAASALSFLAGYPAAWLVNCVIALVYALGSPRHWRAALGVCAALAASVPLFAAQLLPALEARAYMVLEAKYGPGAYGPATLLRAYFTGNWFNFNPNHPASYDPGSLYFYLGLPALFAILWAIWRHNARPYLQPVLGIAVALLLANPPNILLRAVAQIPALNYTMQPFNFYAAVAVMAALMAALGLHDFLESRSPRALPLWALSVCALAPVAWSLRQLQIWYRGGFFASGARAWVETGLALALFSLCLWGLRQSTGQRRVFLTAILLFTAASDFKVYGAGRWFNAAKGDVDDFQAPYGMAGIDDEAYRAMRRNRQYRVATVHGLGPDPVQYRMFGLATPEGFDPFLTAQYKRTIRQWVPFATNRLFYTDVRNERMLQTLGVRYALVRDNSADDTLLAANPLFRLIGPKDTFCHLYEYLHAKPPFHWEDERNGAVEPIVWTPEQRHFLVQSGSGGKFVLVEQFFPGWRASVDGLPVEIERWAETFQAIRVAPGQHHIRFEFEPRSFYLGAAISALSVGALLALLRKRHPSSARSSLSPASLEK